MNTSTPFGITGTQDIRPTDPSGSIRRMAPDLNKLMFAPRQGGGEDPAAKLAEFQRRIAIGKALQQEGGGQGGAVRNPMEGAGNVAQNMAAAYAQKKALQSLSEGGAAANSSSPIAGQPDVAAGMKGGGFLSRAIGKLLMGG